MTNSPCVVSEDHFTAPEFLDDAYKLTFGDHFDQAPGTLPDPSKWDTALPWGPNLIINNEEQYYVDVNNGDTNAPNPFSFDGNSNLIITAGLNSAAQQAATGQQYYSGVLTSFTNNPFQYGYIEMRMKLPEDNQGLWAAFWLLNRFYLPGALATGANGKYEPEIDWEFVRGPGGIFGGGPYTTGGSTGASGGALAFHYDGGQCNIDGGGFDCQGSPGVSQQCDGTQINNVVGLPFAQTPGNVDLALNFHRYGIWWLEDSVRWYLDGVLVGSICHEDIMSQVPMYALCNMAVGGNFAGAADSSDYAGEGVQMLVDYICLFQTPEQEIII